jgi:hypothetical protein
MKLAGYLVAYPAGQLSAAIIWQWLAIVASWLCAMQIQWLAVINVNLAIVCGLMKAKPSV